ALGAGAFEMADLEGLANDRLLLSVLAQERICSILVERLLTAMRTALLETALKAGARDIAPAPVLDLQCALARYCFQTEYVVAVSDREAGQVARLRSAVAGALTEDNAMAASILMAVASYGPLHALPDAGRVAQTPWPAPVEAVIEQQIRVPREVAR